ncbi:DEAD/DEAH box helicase [Amphritea balenae]|uniref:DEAD/DEAH box helicase n=1 Tax=Amphritea balenae TaxID=452629 RepID=A0A3P1SYE9_9GAMM|nr:DEAD/DEAH box helicase [Amphritea balenae]RRD01576.1 DEAD/DEAH box helicase [Amphritea balenae]GGK55795.1 RNA helicase [Amphritea balenae]
MKFSALDLAPEIQQALDACGYSQMTPVQEQAIVPARRGKDLLANAQTGTGKTAAFSLPILQQMTDSPKPTESGYPRTLILTPTRELAEQLAETIKRYAQFLPLTVTAFYGGVNMEGQAKKLRAGVDILISTPGRLLEHVVQCNVSLKKVEFVVLDEADRMLDMGFVADVNTLLQQTSTKRQTLMFSATVTPTVNEFAKQLMTKHQVIRVAKVNATADTVDHVVYPVEEKRKADLFSELINKHQWFQVLVFTSTKAQADELMTDLKIDGIPAVVCHGDKTQGSRRRAIADFKEGKVQVLVATEVAARGLDIQGLELVVNYNLPYLAEDYVHRIGRTGRAGAKGKAISFVSRAEEQALESIEHLIGARIKRINQPGYEVGSRDNLRKQINKKVRKFKTKSNKATKTKILRSKSGTSKPSDRKKKK